MYAILYKSSRFKQIIFSKYANNLKNDYIPQKLENFRFAPIESAVYRRKSRDQYTALSLAEVLVTLYGLYGLCNHNVN